MIILILTQKFNANNMQIINTIYKLYFMITTSSLIVQRKYFISTTAISFTILSKKLFFRKYFEKEKDKNQLL